MKPNNPQHDLQDTTDVLIALASQESEPPEQPPSPEELVDFFENSKRFPEQRQEQILAYLDSNPQAYDRWIKQGNPAKQQSRSLFMLPMTFYAVAAFVALFALGVGLLWRSQSFQLNQAMDRSYQSAALHGDEGSFALTMKTLEDAVQPSGSALGFSSSGQLSSLGQAFMLGLQQDGLKSHKTLPSDVRKEDYLLGRWHTLLWTVSQQKAVLPTEFWQEQLVILDHLQSHYSNRPQEQATPEIKAVVLQLEHMQPMLQTLANNNQAIRTYQDLEQTLAALRYGLMPAL